MHVRTRQEAKRVRVLNIKRTRENEKLSRVLFRSKFLGMGWGLLVIQVPQVNEYSEWKRPEGATANSPRQRLG